MTKCRNKGQKRVKGDPEFLAWEKLVGGDVKMIEFGFGCVCVCVCVRTWPGHTGSLAVPHVPCPVGPAFLWAAGRGRQTLPGPCPQSLPTLWTVTPPGVSVLLETHVTPSPGPCGPVSMSMNVGLCARFKYRIAVLQGQNSP